MKSRRMDLHTPLALPKMHNAQNLTNSNTQSLVPKRQPHSILHCFSRSFWFKKRVHHAHNASARISVNVGPARPFWNRDY